MNTFSFAAQADFLNIVCCVPYKQRTISKKLRKFKNSRFGKNLIQLNYYSIREIPICTTLAHHCHLWGSMYLLWSLNNSGICVDCKNLAGKIFFPRELVII